MARTSIGSIFLTLRATTGELRKDLNRATSRMRAQFNRMAKAAAVAAAALVAALAAMAVRGARELDKLGKAARRLGFETVASLQGMREAAKQFSGIADRQFDVAIQRMVRRISEARAGTGAAGAALKELGLEIEALAKLSPDEQFKSIADAMQGVEKQGDRVRLTMRLFDSEGVALVNTLSAGREAIDAVQERMERLGITMESVEAERVEQMNDSFSMLRAIITGAQMQLAAGFAPAVTALTERVIDLVEEMGGLRAISANVVQGATTGFSVLTAIFQGWIMLVKQGELALLQMANAIPTDFFLAFGLDEFERQAISAFKGSIPDAIQKTRAELDELSRGDPLGSFLQSMRVSAADLTGEFFSVIDSITGGAEEAAKAFSGAVSTIESDLTQLVSSGKLNARRMVDAIIEEFARLNVVRPLLQALVFAGGGEKGILASGFSALFGGGRADGGAVSRGTPYIVGERGHEMFVPNTDGIILPNRMLAGAGAGGGPAVIQNNYFEMIADSRIQAQIAQAAPLIAEATERQIANRQRRRI